MSMRQGYANDISKRYVASPVSVCKLLLALRIRIEVVVLHARTILFGTGFTLLMGSRDIFRLVLDATMTNRTDIVSMESVW